MLYQFSIIIPIYNVAPYLSTCLDSIVSAVNQYGKHVEIICIDDGSTDNSSKLLDNYNWQTKLVVPRIFHQCNAGVSAARNKGLEEATGDYICFVDADDLVEDNWLRAYQQIIEHANVDLVRIHLRDTDCPPCVINIAELKEWLWNTFVKDGYPWTYAVKREIAQTERFPEGVAMCEDSLYAARLVPHIHFGAQLNSCLYKHIVRNDSTMFRRLPSRERLCFLQELLKTAEADNTADKKRLSRMCADAILQWIGRMKDIEHRKNIRSTWKSLNTLGCTDINVVDWLFRPSYWIYANTGLLWPCMFWERLIRIMVALKKKFRH